MLEALTKITVPLSAGLEVLGWDVSGLMILISNDKASHPLYNCCLAPVFSSD